MKNMLRVSLNPLRRPSVRALHRRAARGRSRRMAAMLGELITRREKLLLLYERLVAHSARMQSRLNSVTRRLAALDRAVASLEESRGITRTA